MNQIKYKSFLLIQKKKKNKINEMKLFTTNLKRISINIFIFTTTNIVAKIKKKKFRKKIKTYNFKKL
jgi:hypothetical protein